VKRAGPHGVAVLTGVPVESSGADARPPGAVLLGVLVGLFAAQVERA
jgi:MYXO-CTERM domain-containing protein